MSEQPTPNSADDDRRELELARAAELRCEGKSTRDIAAALGCSTGKVVGLLKIVRRRWQKHMAVHSRRHLAELLQRSQHAERVAWREFERSKQDKKRYSVRTKKPGPKRDDGSLIPEETTTQLDTEGRVGDPRYLTIIQKQQEFRAKLLGLLTDVHEHRLSDAKATPPFTIIYETPQETKVVDAVPAIPPAEPEPAPEPAKSEEPPIGIPLFKYEVHGAGE